MNCMIFLNKYKVNNIYNYVSFTYNKQMIGLIVSRKYNRGEWNMNIEQLQYIIEVSEQGTIAKAAENLHISHSAISQAIASLESELGLTIFKRSRSGSVITKEGKAVVKLSLEIMNKLMELKKLGLDTTELKGNLKIAASTIYFSTFLPEFLYSFRKD